LKIFSSFRKRFGKAIKLVLVGPSLNGKQQAFAKQEGLIDEIIRLSEISERLLRALYSTAVALVFPSLYEGFGWPPLEAQACGCPVVASPLGSLSEILEKGGILIDPKNHEEYAKTIHRLHEDIEFRDQEIRRGSSNANRFDATKTASEYLSLYKQVVSRKTYLSESQQS
jgi:glycosyltransferase involved in cell wall biosynthesis